VKKALKFFVLTLLTCGLIFLTTGCSDDDSNPVGPGESSTKIAIVQTAGDDENNIAVIDYESGTASIDLLPVGGTCNMTQFGDYVYIVDKSNDRIIKFDPYAKNAVSEMSTGAGTSPNTILFLSASKAYVTLSDEPHVAVVNPATMELTGTIDISGMADDDGDPDQYHAVVKDGLCYISLRRSSGRSLTDHSSLAVIDTAADTVVTEAVLATNGIAGASRHCIGGQVIGTQSIGSVMYPYVMGSVSKVSDGAIERFDPETMTSSVVMTEDQIGGNILIWVFDEPSKGYAIVGLGDTSGGEGWGLSRFDLNAGTFVAVSDFQKMDYSWALECTSDGLVLVGSKNEDNPGVFVYDSLNDYKPVFEKPIDVGLLPQRILVVR
jgi:hypothetical protein